MKISKQAAAIAASVAVVLGGSAGAWALSSSGDSGRPVQQAEVPADTTSPSTTTSPTATATASPTDQPTTAVPSTTAPATTQPPASTAAPSPTTTKAKTMSTPQAPATVDPNYVDPTNPNNQNNGGGGTADHGPYPSNPTSTPTLPDPYPVVSQTP